MVVNPIINPAFVWGMLFVFNLLLGGLIFFVIMWDKIPSRFAAPLWALGWLYWAQAASLLTTVLTGRSNPWGYHNLSAPLDILQNSVIAVLALTYLMRTAPETAITRGS